MQSTEEMEDFQKKIAEKAKGRQQFKHGERVVYEWDQNLEYVNIYIEAPPVFAPKTRAELKKQLQPGQTLPELEIRIDTQEVRVGIKGNPPFMQEKLGGQVVKGESLWQIEDNEISIVLCKMKKGETWSCACQGHATLDPLTQTEVQKSLLLERFQQENPGFDFSSATMNGQVPDARTFMGGISYK